MSVNFPHSKDIYPVVHIIDNEIKEKDSSVHNFFLIRQSYQSSFLNMDQFFYGDFSTLIYQPSNLKEFVTVYHHNPDFAEVLACEILAKNNLSKESSFVNRCKGIQEPSATETLLRHLFKATILQNHKKIIYMRLGADFALAPPTRFEAAVEKVKEIWNNMYFKMGLAISLMAAKSTICSILENRIAPFVAEVANRTLSTRVLQVMQFMNSYPLISKTIFGMQLVIPPVFFLGTVSSIISGLTPDRSLVNRVSNVVGYVGTCVVSYKALFFDNLACLSYYGERIKANYPMREDRDQEAEDFFVKRILIHTKSPESPV